jgi:transposase
MPSPAPLSPRPKYVPLDRQQLRWVPLDLEASIPATHPARAIWALTGRLDLHQFEQDIHSLEGQGGRPRWSPQLLISVLIYAYSEGISSVREMTRRMQQDPGLRWLCADEVINYHTLADFRMQHKDRLDELFRNVLALLEQEGLIDLNIVMQDGTKVLAVAGKQSWHRRKTLEEHRERARQALRQLEEQSDNESQPGGEESKPTVAEAARERAAREKVERMDQALLEMERREAEVKPSERDQARVSESEPEARKMKQTDGGWAPSYNVQTSTDAKHKIVVAVTVSQEGNDLHQLQPALPELEAMTGRQPGCMVADGGYCTRENVGAMAGLEIEFVSPWPDAAAREAGARKRNGIDPEFSSAVFTPLPEPDAYRCPTGTLLPFLKSHQHHGHTCRIYQSAAEDCSHCEFHSKCCGQQAARQIHQVVESSEMLDHLERMRKPETKELYKRRKVVAETPHLWWKELFEWRRFSVRGLAKAAKEVLWLGLAYNFRQWARLRYVPALQAA